MKCQKCTFENDNTATICEKCNFSFVDNIFMKIEKTKEQKQEFKDSVIKWSGLIGAVSGMAFMTTFMGIGGAVGGAIGGGIGGLLGASIGYFIVFMFED